MKEVVLIKLGEKILIKYMDDGMIIEATEDDLGKRLTWCDAFAKKGKKE